MIEFARAHSKHGNGTSTQALGFAGCEMIRRIVGLEHVEDFESIVSCA